MRQIINISLNIKSQVYVQMQWCSMTEIDKKGTEYQTLNNLVAIEVANSFSKNQEP